MDPVSAVFNAIGSFFNYLSTAQGQAFAAQLNALNGDFNKQIQDLFNKIHAQATK